MRLHPFFLGEIDAHEVLYKRGVKTHMKKKPKEIIKTAAGAVFFGLQKSYTSHYLEYEEPATGGLQITMSTQNIYIHTSHLSAHRACPDE